MATHQWMGRICITAAAAAVLLLIFLLIAKESGALSQDNTSDYETTLFDDSRIHTIDITLEDTDAFFQSCENEEYTPCQVTIDGETLPNVGFRAKGNTSLKNVASYQNNRYSFKFSFDQYNAGITYKGLDKLCLNNIIQDNTYMKDYLSYKLMQEFDVNAPLCSFAYVTINGEDWGVYLAAEEISIGFLQRNYGTGYGRLYKPDSADRDNGNMDKNANRGINADPTSGNDAAALRYIDDDASSYSAIFDNARTPITNRDKTRLITSLEILNSGNQIEQVVDIEQVIRYFVVHTFVCNFDSYTGTLLHNYYLYEKDGRLSMLPWDYNLAFGGFVGGPDATWMVNHPIDTPVWGGTVESRPMLSWIFSDNTYKALYHEQYQSFLDQWSNGAMEKKIDAACQLISPYVKKETRKFCTYEEFEAGAAALKTFCRLRMESIAEQLKGTIPSDSEGQTEDASTLIDAGDLSLSAMGTMKQDHFQNDAPTGVDTPPSDIPPAPPQNGIQNRRQDNNAPSNDNPSPGDVPKRPFRDDITPDSDGTMSPSPDDHRQTDGEQDDTARAAAVRRASFRTPSMTPDGVQAIANPLPVLGGCILVLIVGLLAAWYRPKNRR